MNHINRDEVFNKHLGGTLPEFQPGRELKGEDIYNVVKDKTAICLATAVCDVIAAELNKIRAPKTGVDLSLVVKQLNDDIRAMTKERDELQSQLEALKSKPVGVTKEQLKSAIESVAGACLFTDTTLEKIAAALSPKWIKCADRMPDMHQKVFWLQERDNLIENGYYAGHVHPATTHWMPRYVPAPPKEEESELVNDLNRLWNESKFSYDEVMKAVKEFEKGAKK